MNICCNFSSVDSPIKLMQTQVVKSAINQRVVIIALAILGFTALYYFCCYQFKAEKVEPEKKALPGNVPFKKKKAEKKEGEQKNTNSLFHGIPDSKVKILGVYKDKPEQCGKVKKMIIFNDIKFIESQGQIRQDIFSVVDLMLYLTELSEVDLNHPICARVIIDVFKECNKETSEQLGEWLRKEKTFNTSLLKSCLQVFIDKLQQQVPFSPYALELLIKTYQEKNWNQTQNASILPSNHPLLVSAMTILIKNSPNDDRIMALTKWMMRQKEYDLNTFEEWVSIFQQKEKEKIALHNLYYPLLNTMIADFKTRWGAKHLKEVSPSVVDYLLQKDPALSIKSCK